MVNFEDNWWLYFVPECFFDTVLLKKLLQTNKRLMHRKGCNNVVNDLRSKRLKNLFAVALIDKDKRTLDYLEDCEIKYDANKLRLLKHKNEHHYIIQLNPPLENWVVDILDENNLAIENFGYPRDFKKLKKKIKDDIDNEKDVRLNELVNAIIKTNCETVRKMKFFLQYLKEKNYQADINELKNA